MKNRPIVLIAAAVTAMTAPALLAVGRHHESPVEAPSGPREPVRVRIIETAFRSTPRYLTASGVVRPQLEASIATKVQGRVVAVLVREGDRVRRGQPLIQLDARDLDAAVAQAKAGVHVASVGLENARVAASMEAALSQARVTQAEAGVSNAEAAVQAARARLQLVQSGPRHQEKTQASLAVAQAKSALTLAEQDLRRYRDLYTQGAVARQQLDIQQSRYDVAKAQYESTVQGQSMAQEGSRAEDIRQASEGVRQAEAALNQARAAVRQARAAALQVNVRRAEVRGAAAQVGSGRAALRMATVTRDYATITAPFDGVVAKRLVDPGSLASPGTPLLVVQGGALQLQAVVPESALSSVRRGARLPLSLDALTGQPLWGRVAEIAPQGDPSSHTFVVKISLPGGSGARAGMYGRARLLTGAERRLMVPSSAIAQREGLGYVYVAGAGGRAELRLVTVGTAEAGAVPVLSGLAAGERIVSDAASVTDGAAITEGR